MEKLPTSDESLKSKQVRQSVFDQDVLLDADTMREDEIGAKVNLDSTPNPKPLPVYGCTRT